MAAKKPKGPQPFDEFVNMGQEYVDRNEHYRKEREEKGAAFDEIYARLNVTIGELLKAKPLSVATITTESGTRDVGVVKTTTVWELDDEDVAKIEKLNLEGSPTHLIRLYFYDENRGTSSPDVSIQYPGSAMEDVKKFMEQLVDKAGDRISEIYEPTKPKPKPKPRVKKPAAKGGAK